MLSETEFVEPTDFGGRNSVDCDRCCLALNNDFDNGVEGNPDDFGRDICRVSLTYLTICNAAI